MAGTSPATTERTVQKAPRALSWRLRGRPHRRQSGVIACPGERAYLNARRAREAAPAREAVR